MEARNQHHAKAAKALLGLSASFLLLSCTQQKFDYIPQAPSKLAPQPPSVTPSPIRQPTPVPTPATVATESFTQDHSANKVDILIINDNSGSMDKEQRKMSERFESLISALKDIDYQIALTTTDIDTHLGSFGRILPWEGAGTKILTSRVKNAEKAFKKTVQRSETIGCDIGGKVCPSKNEQPLMAMMLAMEQRYTANAGFFRDGVDLAVVVLSDEDEMSHGTREATKPRDVLNAFDAHFGKTKQLAVHGILIQPGDEKCLKEQRDQAPKGDAGAYGTHVTELAELTGGVTGSICEKDYGAQLKAISEQVRRLVGTFELHQVPRPGSVKVVLTPAMKTSFKVEGKKVIFDTPPPAGTRVEISYEY